MKARRTREYLGENEDQPDLQDQIANSSFDDPEPRIWISPPSRLDPDAGWNASYQFGTEGEDFTGTRDDVIVWARSRPATGRFIWAGHGYVDLESTAHDAPPPGPPGPTVQVQGPDHDGRWVALWFHRGELKQFWGTQQHVTAWASAQPAERRVISAHGKGWQRLEP